MPYFMACFRYKKSHLLREIRKGGFCKIYIAPALDYLGMGQYMLP